ncbi:hypothetical protein EYF80_039368 [Liparis tanakae]|uniref:Uncharacterized protein n=1 Tax=Liparis tanakae TaxID=230148 RepID=A0A4Z2GCS8_9TELE|nr:hypothetical protein EYF80_039368 [Liparis tanakae]
MRKSPILRPALQATPPSSTDSRYCSAGNAGVGEHGLLLNDVVTEKEEEQRGGERQGEQGKL